MLFMNQSFIERIRFFELGICDLPEELTKESIITKKDPEKVFKGLVLLRDIFSSIYKSYDMFDEKDPLISFNNSLYTVMFLYYAAKTGEFVVNDKDKLCIINNRKVLKSEFKHSISYSVSKLEHFDFEFEFTNDGKETESVSRSKEINITHKLDSIIYAIYHLVKENDLKLDNEDFALMRILFCKLDYNSIILKTSTKREEISPIRKDILSVSGKRRKLLESLLLQITDEYPLKSNVKIHEYATPHWIIKYTDTSKGKFAFNINVGVDKVVLEIRLSVDTIETLAKSKDKLNKKLADLLDEFGCISCNKKCNEDNVREVNGVRYCTAYSEARLLMYELENEEDVKAALLILDIEI